MGLPIRELQKRLNLAAQLQLSGDRQGAVLELKSVLEDEPDCIDALRSLAALQFSLQDFLGARVSAEHLLNFQSNLPDAMAIAGWAAYSIGDMNAAERFAERLVTTQLRDSRALLLLCLVRWSQGNLSEALELIDHALRISPYDAELMAAKAQVLARLNWTSQAIEWYRKSLKLQPNLALALEYCQLLREEGFTDLAVSTMSTYVSSNPLSLQAHESAAQALTEAHRYDDAEVCWNRAEALGADRNSLIQMRVQSEVYAGRIDTAKNLIKEELVRDPNYYGLYLTFSSIHRFNSSDLHLIDQMERISSESNQKEVKREIGFALGKAYSDVEEYELAMGAYDQANKISLELNPVALQFSPSAWSWYTDRQIEYFTGSRIAELKGSGNRSAEVLFILGMIRSGTTLTEQILSQHSKISDGGEKTFWADHRNEIFDPVHMHYHATEASLLSNSYLKLMTPHLGAGQFVTEKNPANITLAAMLACVFPNSKMIHLKRHPVDNLLSIWMTPLRTGLPFVNDKKNLVSAFRDHLRWESHLREVMPSSQFFTMGYEELTSEPAQAVGNVLRWLGLEYEQECLHPEANTRTVRTPSFFQVRQPISTGSQAKWRRFLPWLGPFEELLDE